MSQGLNLVPNPFIVIIQMIVFLLSMFSVKKLILEPYLKIKRLREQATIGETQNVKELLKKNDEQAQNIAERLKETAKRAVQEQNNLRTAAYQRRTDLLSTAEHDAKQQIELIKKEIAGLLVTERQKLPEIIRRLTNEFYSELVH